MYELRVNFCSGAGSQPIRAHAHSSSRLDQALRWQAELRGFHQTSTWLIFSVNTQGLTPFLFLDWILPLFFLSFIQSKVELELCSPIAGWGLGPGLERERRVVSRGKQGKVCLFCFFPLLLASSLCCSRERMMFRRAVQLFMDDPGHLQSLSLSVEYHILLLIRNSSLSLSLSEHLTASLSFAASPSLPPSPGERELGLIGISF